VEYVATAEERGVESYPLYEWTKATIENPSKKEKYLKSFTVYVDGREVCEREIADGIEADLQPLASGSLIARISKPVAGMSDNGWLGQSLTTVREAPPSSRRILPMKECLSCAIRPAARFWRTGPFPGHCRADTAR
jgi:hypothetical protein